MAEIYQLPENGNGNSGFGNIPFSIPIGGFGGGLFGNGGYGDTNSVFDSDGDSAVRDDPATEYNESDEISSGMYESDGMTDSSDEHRTAVDPAANTMAPGSAMAGGGAMTAVLAITAAIAAALLLIFGFAANRKLER